MARKPKAKESSEQASDAPILDTKNTAIKQLIKKGKERGFVTHDELNEALPQDELSSEQIEDVMSSLDQMGVSVVEAAEEVETANENEDTQSSGNVSDDVSNSDDPVRMYLREMGSVELLSRGRDSDCQADRSRTRDDDRRHLRMSACYKCRAGMG